MKNFIITFIVCLLALVVSAQTKVDSWTQIDQRGDTIKMAEYFISEPPMTFSMPDSLQLLGHDQVVAWAGDDLECLYTNLGDVHTEEDSLVGYEIPLSMRFAVIRKTGGNYFVVLNLVSPFSDFAKVITVEAIPIYPLDVEGIKYRKVSFWCNINTEDEIYIQLDFKYKDLFVVYQAQSFLFENIRIGYKN